MASIALLTAHDRFPWSRQIPGGGAACEGFRFTFGTIAPDCVLAAVSDDPGREIAVPLPRERRLVILTEPPGIKTYAPGYLDQFGIVMGPVPAPSHRGRSIIGQPGLPWFYGVALGAGGNVAHHDADSLAALPPAPKEAAISVVLSRKSRLPKHRARLAFVEMAEKRLGARLRIFGRGFREIADKAEAIAPFACHLVLENNDLDHFWTEKTADAYLGWALPLFSGCANLDAYFPAESFVRIDIARPEAAIDAMAAALETGQQALRRDAIAEARRRLIAEHNLFALLPRIARDLAGAPEAAASFTLRPNAAFGLLSRMRRLARRASA
jgi:hypothetical protein